MVNEKSRSVLQVLPWRAIMDAWKASSSSSGKCRSNSFSSVRSESLASICANDNRVIDS